MKYIAWKHDEKLWDRLLYVSDVGGITSFPHHAKKFNEYPKDLEDKGFTIQPWYAE